jgi:3',5'-nucleoside bisphosphate phosphatase
LKRFECDFHIHSTLSPCSSLEMSPKNIVLRAKEVGLDIIAVTDHNMAENGPYVARLGYEADLLVLFGMELQTREEIHLLVLFGSDQAALDFQNEIYRSLPDVKNDVDYFGDQVVVDENDVIVRFEERLLLNSVQISLEDAVKRIKDLGGLVIPSHIDSPTFSIISQLGFVPAALALDALEVRDSRNMEAILPFVLSKDIPFVSFSDAHCLADIGKRRTILSLEKAGFGEVTRALQEMRNDNLRGKAHP